jgi:multiple sugar transport system substrate-binding protein
MMDGEWRVAFIAAEHPELQYGTAPMPAMSPALYGSGYINGTIIGIPKNGKNRDAAWDLVKYLTTNNHALAEFSNGIRNVPSTVSSTTSKELKPDAHFATFGKIFTNPKSQTTPITSVGAAHLDTFQSFLAKWQAGKVKDLTGGLKDVDKQIDAKLKQAGAGGAP